MKTPYLQTETRAGITQDEYERLNSPYHQQQELLDNLHLIWDHNAAILHAHGYCVPSDWTGRPATQAVVEPEAVEAARIITACCRLWETINSKDPFAIANAGIWLGMMLSGEPYRQYQSRNGRQPRSVEIMKAREVFRSRDNWQSAKEFIKAVEQNGIRVSPHQGTNWFTDFGKER